MMVDNEDDRVEAFSVVGQLASHLAATFNDELTVMLTHLEMLERKGVAADAAADLAETKASAERACAIVAELQRLCVSPPVPEDTIHLRSVLTVRRHEYEKILGDGATLKVITTEVGTIRMAEADLHRIIVELLTNAVEASARNVVLTLQLAAAAAESTRAVELIVQDDGDGMTPEFSAHAFEPFRGTRGRPGSGLTLVHALARQHAATVRLESAEGAGTKVTLSLRQAEKVAPRRQPLMSGITPRTMAIMVVDDQVGVSTMVERLLTHDGHHVTLTNSPTEAIEMSDEQRFDLVVTDVAMPGMTGITLAERLWSKHPRLPVLFISGYPKRQLPKPNGTAPTGFVQKPFSFEDLSGAVDDLLGRAQKLADQG